MKTFVAFLDILGFKDLVDKNSGDDLIEIYQSAFEFNYKASFLAMEEVKRPDSGAVHSLIISDSILVWSDNDGFNSFVEILMTVKFLVQSSIMVGMPLRGCLHYGELVELESSKVSKSSLRNVPIMLGKGITAAYTAEGLQNWSGCIVSNEAIDRYLELFEDGAISLKDLVELEVLIQYKVPMKKGQIRDLYAINWLLNKSIKPPTAKMIRESFKAYGKDISSWEVEEKIKNTIDFVKFCARDRQRRERLERIGATKGRPNA
ncbi:MAG: hypothetical protein EOP49_12110 [Sphingobacteriales bacterium]|nr:MAG: hypothetical protein EOP49_12110 [Sphingobacteriales bacterium]